MKLNLNKLPRKPSNWKEHKDCSGLKIVDWDGEYFKINKNIIPKGHGGCCAYKNDAPILNNNLNAPCVNIKMQRPLDIITMGFKNNAWKKDKIKQCDAILFPSSDNSDDIFLLIEIKYCIDNNGWQDYRDSALEQITDTISELKKNKCPVNTRKIFGLISCPLISINHIGASAFSQEELRDIYMKHQVEINIHMGNKVLLIDEQNIEFF